MRTYLRLFRFALPYKWHLAAALLCMVILAGATTAYVNLLGPALDFLFTGKTTAAAQLARLVPRSVDLLGFLGRVDRHQLLTALPFVIFFMALVKGVAYFGQFFLMNVVSQRLIADLRRALFDRLVRLPPAFYSRRHSGDIVSRFSQDVAMVQNAVTDAIATYLRDGLTVVVMLVNCFILDWKMSLMVFGAVPATLFPVIRISKRIRSSTGASVATLGTIVEIVIEALAGIRVVQAFGMERWESNRFAGANNRLLRLERRIAAIRGTTLVIAHQLSTIRHADRIVVLADGRVVKSGKHDELLAAGGEYARLWRIFEGGRSGPPSVTSVPTYLSELG